MLGEFSISIVVVVVVVFAAAVVGGGGRTNADMAAGRVVSLFCIVLRAIAFWKVLSEDIVFQSLDDEGEANGLY